MVCMQWLIFIQFTQVQPNQLFFLLYWLLWSVISNAGSIKIKKKGNMLNSVFTSQICSWRMHVKNILYLWENRRLIPDLKNITKNNTINHMKNHVRILLFLHACIFYIIKIAHVYKKVLYKVNYGTIVTLPKYGKSGTGWKGGHKHSKNP